MSVSRFADAVRCWRSGQQLAAEHLCKAAIDENPQDPDPYRLLTEILATSGRGTEAVVACRRIALLAPHDAANLRRLAELLSQSGETLAAIDVLMRSLELDAGNPRALNNLGNLLTQVGRSTEAIRLLERAIAAQPAYPIALNNLGIALGRAGRLDEAIDRYRQALELKADFPEALSNLTNALASAGRTSESPWHDATLGRVHALLSLDRAADSLAACDEIRSQLGNVAGLRGLRASALPGVERLAEAIAEASDAVELEPTDARAHVALGFALIAGGFAERALAAFDRAATLQPRLAKAHAGRGLALAAVGRGGEAIDAYARAAQLDPRDTSIFKEVGYLMVRLGRIANANAAFGEALRLAPDHVPALEGHVMTLMALNRHEEALAGMAKLRILAPEIHYLPGQQLYARLHCCDWDNFDAASRDITEGIRRGEHADTPLSLLAHSDSPADQRLCAQKFVADKCSADMPLTRRTAGVAPGSRRLRIGYLSADYADHPVAQLIAGVIEAHDRSQVEIFGLSAGFDDGSPLRRRMEQAFEHFVDVSAMQDRGVAAHMTELGLDIAVDLGGHTAGSRMRVLAYRPAPVQIAFLGYPGTSGADYIDYLIADHQVIPEKQRQHYTENVIYLPGSYLPGDFLAPLEPSPSRRVAGLPETGFVYCSFNAAYKIVPTLFDAWMRILAEVPGSVLWLRGGSASAWKNLAKRAEQRGIDPARLIGAPRVATSAEHYARLALADVFLDTHPYNAHTTASDALRAGVPVITLQGNSFASRVAGSLLHTCGLEELAVGSLERYEQLAIELAHAPDSLINLKERLRHHRASSSLFDPVRFCRLLEAAYAEASDRSRRGEPARILTVTSRL